MKPALLLALTLALATQTSLAGPAADPATLDYRLQARALAPDVYVVEGANADFQLANGCNIINTGFIVTEAGVLVINTGPSRRYGEQLRALIARTTTRPLLQVLLLNQHPDYFLGNQAFADVPRLASAATRSAMAANAASYESNLYRLCGDWMKGTETLLPDGPVRPGVQQLGAHEIELLELDGHTESDLVLIDRSAGVVFAGGLVFSQRVPTTPHASLAPWQAGLKTLAALPYPWWVPSHGGVDAARDGAAIAMTQRYLSWLDQRFRSAAEQGLDMMELLRQPVPEEFRRWAAFETEYLRNVAHLYPRYEQAQLLKTP
ncbi:quinoprotein relay system zinc metallohydrolase 1 [Paucibacter oligotrophus]|uniref:Quinoprotein relay system zinc metallohydrolase 1 n=1 Tax=Roseateles oligotrophus TaxID=1769250 RepID=A0A840L4Z7_9BURK|nr:quinoprotein relay system zinc metallohydrolase 1 [Roseateles oligotrophus]MBB4841752.1 quinoprotein relay system zinc metallohydrolase 1 [Roseateles oligotrophus]